MGKLLLNVLQEAQDRHGYLSESVLKRISTQQGIPIARLYGVVKFYSMLRTEPQGKHVIEICGSPSCMLNNGMRIEQFLEKETGVRIGETDRDGLFSLYKISCIGCCDESPAILIDRKPYTRLTVERMRRILAGLKAKKGGVAAAARMRARKAHGHGARAKR